MPLSMQRWGPRAPPERAGFPRGGRLPRGGLRAGAFAPAEGLDDPPLDRHDLLELRPQDVGVDEVRHPHAEAADLVLEAGADPAHRRARPEAPFQLLLEAVDRLVVRHADVRAGAGPQARRGG